MDNSSQTPACFFHFQPACVNGAGLRTYCAARPRRLLVVADGPRAGRPGEGALCKAARNVVTSPDWRCEVLTNCSDENLGCKRRLSSGLDWVFDQCSEAIILEDDCLPGASFFPFCTAMLERYRDDSRIMHISGDNFQDGNRRGTDSYFFSRYSLSWGWASWRRAWEHYDINVSLWPRAKKESWLDSILDDSLEIEYWTDIFDKLHRGEIDTWDYQWLFACWYRNGLSIQPAENLVKNIGAGPDATHFKSDHSTLGIPAHELEELAHPRVVVRDREADRYTFEEHIAGKRMREEKRWLRKARNRLALRTRVKGLLRPRVR